MYFYLSYDRIQEIITNINFMIDISLFSDFEKIVVFILFNILYYIGIYLFVKMAYKIFFRIWNFIF